LKTMDNQKGKKWWALHRPEDPEGDAQIAKNMDYAESIGALKPSMSNTIQLEPIETDLTGWGPEYHRRKREPMEPYYVENLNFDDAVQKEFPNRDAEVEQYLLNQAHKRGQDPNRPFQKILKAPDWGKGGDKIRTEYHDPKSQSRKTTEKAHYAPRQVVGYYLDEDGGPDKNNPYIEDTTIRLFEKEPTDPSEPYGNSEYPYIHEAMHHITSDQGGSGYERNFDFGSPWLNSPNEIMSEAAKRKRAYVHGSNGYAEGFEPPNQKWLDSAHPAVKEGKPIPEKHIDDMFIDWMNKDNAGWGDSYRYNPEDFPVELFKEALRLGKNDQKPAGMFTGRKSQNA
jgi:hypothetical protein